MQSKTSNGWTWKPDVSQAMSNHVKTSPDKTATVKMKRCSSNNQFNSLYNQDSTAVPKYYSRPGPGNYQVDQGLGKYTQVSLFQNSPSYAFSKPQTVAASNFASIVNFKKQRTLNTISH